MTTGQRLGAGLLAVALLCMVAAPSRPAMTVAVRPARRSDTPLIYGFIRQLAEYEKLLDAVDAAEQDIAAALWAEPPRAFCDIAEADGRPIGFALWFYSFSTFRGRAGIYLEDLFVVPEARGLGAGKALLTGLAQRCAREGLGRLEWAGAELERPGDPLLRRPRREAMDGWTVRRLSGDALKAVADEAPP
ncbi:MAG: GNAT family N-acetyltransferase [Caulobacteraceae bacterium]